ncbi:hypothetical protein PFICI_06555 [Pestalotiopsis fici W106-1]|uniref:Xylanolytic transcriptional activator regulatory domain-containing protein n=1 Tax=Pestalotiopsis fici (strain W106-1 / CGMCC3.15140) TaxID=1229662 RepID=W3X5Z8_PESFW|nr:uncharacterized protein PFICI_06555 [Pestalotiopsis fici W106-1]ETS81553.1 hypothetical protein PFICI_06555 [Pestalotiopsis fici W106-1]
MDTIKQSLKDVLRHINTGNVVRDGGDGDTFQPAPSESAAGLPGNDVQIWEPAQQIPAMDSFETCPPLMPLDQFQASATVSSHPSSSLGATMQSHGSRSLPPDGILTELSELFFEFIYPWAPIFFRPTFSANLFAPGRRLLLHGLVVACFRFWKKSEPSTKVREAYVSNSREQILLKAINAHSLVSAQALTLLAIDAVGQGPCPRTCNIMAMLLSTTQQLRLAKRSLPASGGSNTALVRNEDSDDDLCSSSIEEEEKCRLFWTIYSLDRFSSMLHGQSGGLDTKSIRLPYPVGDEEWGQVIAPEWFVTGSKPTHRDCTARLRHHQIDLLALLDRSNRLLTHPVNLGLPAPCQEWQSNFRCLDITLSTWFEKLPQNVRELPDRFDWSWIMLHATFHLINIRMYTVAAFPSTTSPYLRPSSVARSRCRQAIRSVTCLTSSLQPHELEKLGPVFAFVVWVAARTLVILWTTGYENANGTTPDDLEPLLGILRHQALIWPCAQRHAEIIQLIVDTRDNPGGPTGIDIFNDTRRTSYGLQKHLGTLAGHPIAVEAFSNSFDFLDIPMLDEGELAFNRIETFGSETDGEWLY